MCVAENSDIFTLGLAFGFTAFCIVLGSTYFQRLVQVGAGCWSPYVTHVWVGMHACGATTGGLVVYRHVVHIGAGWWCPLGASRHIPEVRVCWAGRRAGSMHLAPPAPSSPCVPPPPPEPAPTPSARSALSCTMRCAPLSACKSTPTAHYSPWARARPALLAPTA